MFDKIYKQKNFKMMFFTFKILEFFQLKKKEKQSLKISLLFDRRTVV